MNRVIIDGAVASVKANTSGKPRLNVRIAHKRGDRPTEFWNVTIWDKAAKYLWPKLRKGMVIIVDGYLTQYNTDDGETVTFINANEVYLRYPWSKVADAEHEAAPKPQGQVKQLDVASTPEPPAAKEEPDDDPFAIDEGDPFGV